MRKRQIRKKSDAQVAFQYLADNVFNKSERVAHFVNKTYVGNDKFSYVLNDLDHNEILASNKFKEGAR